MNDWEQAIEEGKVVKIAPNQERVKALTASSEKLLRIIEKLKLDNENGFFIVTCSPH